jgi:hypothetical protein
VVRTDQQAPYASAAGAAPVRAQVDEFVASWNQADFTANITYKIQLRIAIK